MIRPRWRKVFKDFWSHKGRSILVIASIFIGVFNVGMSIALMVVVGEDMNTSWDTANPSAASIYTSGFEPDFLESVRHVEGVAQAEGRRVANVRMKKDSGEWISLALYTRPEFSPDGSRVLYADFALGKSLIQQMDFPSGDNVYILTDFGMEFQCTYNHDMTMIAYASTRDDNTDIYVLDLVTFDETRITYTIEADEYPTFSPDGKRLAFVSYR